MEVVLSDLLSPYFPFKYDDDVVATIFQNYIVPAPDDLLPRLPDSVFLQGTGIVVFLKFVQSIMTGPILEELLCRAYVMNTFFKNSRFHLDVLVSALLFSGLHLAFVFRDPISFLLFFVGGVFLAEIYKKHRDLRLVILLHAFYNFLPYWKPIWIFVYNYIYWHFLV